MFSGETNGQYRVIRAKWVPQMIFMVFVFVLLKWGYRHATPTHLSAFLSPTSAMIGVLFSSPGENINGSFSHEKLKIVIDKSCSGFQFWLLLSTLLGVLMCTYAKTTPERWISVTVAWVIGYICTLWVNVSRITASITLEPLFKSTYPELSSLSHQSIGIAIHLGFLILIYVLTEYLINTYFSNEKHPAS
jgi:exosortase K